MHTFRVAALAASLLAPWSAMAQQTVLDVEAIPGLQAAGRSSYRSFLLVNLPRAAAVASNGAYGWYGGGSSTIERARSESLKQCVEKGGTDCRLYVEGLAVVFDDPLRVAPAVPGPLIETRSYAFIPDNRFLWLGPERAKGVIIWAHGTGGRGLQPPSQIRAFNNAGYDVVRFDRQAGDDWDDYADDWLRDGIVELRRRGWRTVIASGQSRGAWNALQMLHTPGLVDGVIAVSPANLRWTSPAEQEAGISRIVHRAASPDARVVIEQFEGDNFISDPAERARLYQSDLRPHVRAFLLLDRPAGFHGHSGGGSAQFAFKFGRCLVRFIATGEACAQAVSAN